MAKSHRSLWLFLAVLGLAAVFTFPASASIGVYLSPPDVETAIDSAITGTATEDFSSRTGGTTLGTSYLSTATGITYTKDSGTINFKANDQYGGNGEGVYLGVALNSSVTLTLPNSVAYFGLYFTAGDVFNRMQFYSGSDLVFTFTNSSALNLLSGPTVTAINGSVYQTRDYFGQPTTNLNSNDVYAYLHFIGDAGTTFDRVVLSQGSTAVFESDNHSLRTTAPSIPGSLVVVPEPSTWAMFAASGVVFAVVGVRRKFSKAS